MSVVLPARDAAGFVEAAVMSVLSQTWSTVECVVVDDGSRDDTAALVSAMQDPRVRVIKQAPKGVAGARNVGIAAARGDLFAFLDADDIWLPGKLAAQIERLDAEPDAGAVVCGYTIVDIDLRAILTVRPQVADLDMRSWLSGEGNGLLISSTGVFRRSTIEAVGGFDETFSTSADLDFAARVAKHSPVVAVSQSFVLYRSHPSQMHRDLELYEHDASRVIAQHLDGPAATRALANLHTRLFVYRSMRREWRLAAKAAFRAWRTDPRRFVMLPPAVALRRIRQRITR